MNEPAAAAGIETPIGFHPHRAQKGPNRVGMCRVLMAFEQVQRATTPILDFPRCLVAFHLFPVPIVPGKKEQGFAKRSRSLIHTT